MLSKSVLAGLLLSILLVVFILELVRRRQLREEYSLLWLVVGILMFVMVLWKSALDLVARMVGIYYPPSALFLLGLVFIVVLLLHFSTVISRLTEQNKELAQEIALLRHKVEKRG